jgi:hypothetical protein
VGGGGGGDCDAGWSWPYGAMATGSQLFGRTLVAGADPADLALTFDDGPNGKTMERLKFARLSCKLSREQECAAALQHAATRADEFTPGLNRRNCRQHI